MDLIAVSTSISSSASTRMRLMRRKEQDEGGRMKDESVTTQIEWLCFHPSAFILYLTSCLLDMRDGAVPQSLNQTTIQKANDPRERRAFRLTWQRMRLTLPSARQRIRATPPHRNRMARA